MPRLTFFCELSSPNLTALFADGSVVRALRALDASVSLGLVDLSDERAAIVRQLNAAGVPVIAWQLLPPDQGYWFNLRNAALAAARYVAFRDWTARHGLIWDGVGIDVEPDAGELQRASANRWTALPAIARRMLRPEALRQANRDYAALVARIHSDGYRVDSYILKMILDERAAGSTVLQQFNGLVDVPADREIVMLYTSFCPGRSSAYLWSYGVGAQAVAVGSTGGGVAVAGIDQVPPLSWDEFRRDLLLARRHTDDVHVFSLEGCVRHGYLDRLIDIDWNTPVDVPDTASVSLRRFWIRALLWALARPVPAVLALLAALLLLRRLVSRAAFS